jgi:WD40 repeat protein
MSKSIIQQQLYEILLSKLPNVLIDIIYHYAQCFYENYSNTIKRYSDIENITIVGNNLFVCNPHLNRIYTYDVNTNRILSVTVDCYDLYDGINDQIEKNLIKFSGKQSGYYPRNNNLLKNCWREDDKYVITSNDEYKFTYSKFNHDINVFEKKSDKYVTHIIEEYKRSRMTIKSIKKNIIAYNNILYVIGNIEYNEIYNDNYIQLYDTSTFKFIRNFGEHRDLQEVDFCNKKPMPKYIARTDDKTFVCMDNNTIEIWTNKEHL